MNRSIKIVLALSLFCGLGSQAQKKNYTIDEAYVDNIFKIKSVGGYHSMPNGNEYAEVVNENNEWTLVKKKFNNDQDKTIIVAKSELNGVKESIDKFDFSDNENLLLLFTSAEYIYRRSAKYEVYLYDRTQKSTIKIANEKILHATLSPDNKKVAYVKNNNLYVFDIASQSTTAITTDGAPNKIINGSCDWVYEEEFEFTKAFEWSENSQSIAYLQFDEQSVKEYTMQYFEKLYPRNYTFKYPKAGEDNSKLKLIIYQLKNANSKQVDLGIKNEFYIPRIKWGKNNNLAVITLNRLQNNLKIYYVNEASNLAKEVYNETDPTYVEISNNIRFLKDNSFIITSEKNGNNHLYWYSDQGQLKKQLTTGSWEVRELIGLDPAEKTVYYTSSQVSPIENHVYALALNGGKTTRLTTESGWHEPAFSSNMTYFLDQYSNISTPPQSLLKNIKAQTIKELETNKKFLSKYEEYNNAPQELITIPANGEMLNAIIMKPTNFDSQKKYPVLLYQYSGPGSQTVKNTFFMQHHYFHQYLTQKGYIIVIADGRGTGGRGAKFKKMTYRQLGKYESDDQIAVAQWLQAQPFVDPLRIGIWGWSFGGYMSAICIMKGAEMFKTAIAVAPVTNWRYYDNIYTERYMGLPADNAQGYDDNSPTSMVDRLKGNFLIIHGLTDDNVHFQNTAMLVDEMAKKNKKYDSEIYPNKAHGLSGRRVHLYHKMDRYLTEFL